MRTLKDCSNDIRVSAQQKGISLTEKDVLDLLDKYEREIKTLNKSVIGDPQHKAIIEKITENKRQEKIKAYIEKRNRVLNLVRYTQFKDHIDSYNGPVGEAIEAFLVGTHKNVLNGRRSVDYQQKAIFNEEFGTVLAALDAEDLIPVFKSGKLDQAIKREIFVYRAKSDVDIDGTMRTAGQFGASGIPEAAKIAKILVKAQSRMLRRKNKNGAFIAELESWMVRQDHDASLMRKAGFDEWYRFINENDLLDIPKMKSHLDPKKADEMKAKASREGRPITDEVAVNMALEASLRESYNNLVMGNHMKVDDIQGFKDADKITAFKGPANLAKSASQSRTIHFKGPDQAHEYSKRFSRMSFSEAFMSGLEHDAQTIGLLEALGPNPKAMLDRVVSEYQAKETPAIKKPINRKRIENQMMEVDGSMRTRGVTTPIFGGADFADIAGGWRMLQNMIRLGAATISSFSDIATKAAAIHSMTDKNIFQSYAVALGDVFSNMNTKDQRQLAFLLNVGVESMQQNFLSRFGSNDSGPGQIAKLQQMFFKYNGMQWWNKKQKVGVARVLAADFASKKNLSFDRLPEQSQSLLNRYGIQQDDWDLLRTAEMKAADGKEYMVAQAVENLDQIEVDKVISAKTGKLIIDDGMRTSFLDELRGKLGTLYADTADIAIPTPGAKERAIMNQGLMRGTPAGEAIRTIMQLKAFPITYLTKGVASQYHMSGKVGIAKMMIGSTIMGYLSMAAKDILRGREPREVFSDDYTKTKDTFVAAFLQGGGAGIFGDFIFGEANRYGQSFTTTLLGPTAGTADDIYTIYSKVVQGDDASSNAMKLALQNAPFVNLFYTRAAMEYLFLFGLQEASNPGYLRRMEKRLKDEYDQEYLFSPSEYAVQF
ncbi:MAG: hypothetical protein VW496_01625 [Pelagibacteraceae bacterium]